MEVIKFLLVENVSAKMDFMISKVSACNVLQERLGMESFVTVNQLATGVWDSQIPTLLMEAVHVSLDMSSLMDAVFQNDLFIATFFRIFNNIKVSVI